MELLTLLIVLAIVGLFIGALARLALPGRDPMSIPMTIGIGLAGSFIGGLIGRALFGRGGGGSILLSVICAAAILYFVRRSRGGGLTDPGAPPAY